MSDLMFTIGVPTVSSLGMQGTYLLVEVSFPVQETICGKSYLFGKRALILKMNAEDLPMHSVNGEAEYFDIGPYLREKLSEGTWEEDGL